MDFLTRIRSKSPFVRTQYALGTASVVTGIIAVIWISTVPARMAHVREFAASSTEAFSQNANVVQPTIATSTGETNALDSLGTYSDDSTTTTELEITPEAATASPTEATPPPIVATPSTTAPAPKVIQIGTTSKKAQ